MVIVKTPTDLGSTAHLAACLRYVMEPIMIGCCTIDLSFHELGMMAKNGAIVLGKTFCGN